MTDSSFGQLLLDGTDYALTYALCRIGNGLVDIWADGSNCCFSFSRLPFGEAPTEQNLVGRAWEPSFDDFNAFDTLQEEDFIVFDDAEFHPYAACLRCVGPHLQYNVFYVATYDAKPEKDSGNTLHATAKRR